MASGNFISSTGTNANLYVVWSSTTNVATNTSSVTAVVYLRSYTMRFTALTNSYITINGNQLKFNGKVVNKSSSSLTDTELARHTVAVTHNSDGKKSITITANLDFNGTVSGTYIDDITASKTVTLDTIPRASGLSVPTSVNTGSNLTATISLANSAFTHKLEYFIGGVSKGVSGTIAAGTTTYAHTIQHAWVPNANSVTMTVRLYTYSGSTEVGRTEKTVTVNVPATLIPSVTSITPTVVNGLNSSGTVVATGGYCVEGKSQVKLVVAATAGSGSTLSSYEFSGPNISGNATTLTSTNSTVTSSIIKTPGTARYGVIAKDQRPNRASTQKTTDVTVYSYASPQITSITAQRCDADGTLNKDGTYAWVTVNTSHSSVNGANKRVVTLYSSKDNYASGTVVLAATSTANTFSGIYGSGFNIGSAYTIRAVITDSYNTGNTINKSTTLKVAERTLNIAKDGNGLAIGGLSSVTSATSAPKFECNWDATFAQQVRINDSIARSFEVNRLNMLVDVNNDGANESAYIRGQYYIDDDGSLMIRRRYSLDSGVNHTTQGYLRINNDGMDVGYGIKTPRLQVTSSVDADAYTQNDVALRVGNPLATHLDIDGNEIIAKNGATKLAELYLQGNALGLYTNDTLAMTIGTDATNAYVQSTPVYARTYTGAANMYITSSGTFGRSTASSERYKKDIADVADETLNPYKILDIPVRQFRYNEDNIPVDGKPDDLYIGLIAEEVNEAYPAAAEYTEDGQVEMWNIKILFPALLKIVQDQQKEIEALKEQINNKVVRE
jgi:hypothetical protein